MALIHTDPFAHYAAAQYTQVYTIGPSGAVLAIGAYGPVGRPGLRFSGDLAYSVERLGITTSGAVCLAQWDFRISSAPASTNILFGCLLGSTTHQCTIDLNSDRTLAVYRGSAGTKTQLGSNSTYVVPLDTHIHIGVKFTIANSGGSLLVHVWEDGDTAAQVVLNVTGVDSQEGATATWDGFTIGSGTTGNTDWANLVVMDGSGSHMNDLLGPVDVWALWANARTASALTDWTLSAGTDAAALTLDLTPDDDTTYLEESTQNQQMTVAVDPVPHPSRTIYGAQLYASVKKTSGAPTLKAIGYESATANLGATYTAAASYKYLCEPYSAMPSGTAFSTAAVFDALQWGLKLTTTSTTARVTQIVVALIQARGLGSRNLATGYGHTVSGYDNLAAGHSNSIEGAKSQAHGFGGAVIGERTVLFNLDGVSRTVTGDGKFEVYGEIGGDLAVAIANAVQLIEEQTPTGTSATFSSLGSYRHLRLIATGRGDTAATTIGVLLTFNGDGTAAYDRQYVQGTGATASATEALATNTQGVINFTAANATAGLAGSGEIMIYDYRSTTFEKMVTATGTTKVGTSSGNLVVRTTAFHWRNTAAITSLTVTASSGNFIAGTKFALYGIP